VSNLHLERPQTGRQSEVESEKNDLRGHGGIVRIRARPCSNIGIG
jgi:hypothetical protein